MSPGYWRCVWKGTLTNDSVRLDNVVHLNLFCKTQSMDWFSVCRVLNLPEKEEAKITTGFNPRPLYQVMKPLFLHFWDFCSLSVSIVILPACLETKKKGSCPFDHCGLQLFIPAHTLFLVLTLWWLCPVSLNPPVWCLWSRLGVTAMELVLWQDEPSLPSTPTPTVSTEDHLTSEWC